MSDIEEKIKKYVTNGGKLYIITRIGEYRDGGTVLIEADYPEIRYTVHHKDKTLHKNGMPSNENIVTDENEIAYFVDRLNRYQSSLMYKINKTKELINHFG